MNEQESERAVSCSQPLSSFGEGGEGLATRGHLREGDSSLASMVASLIARKLGAPGREMQVTELLSRRRKRWRKRHGGNLP